MVNTNTDMDKEGKVLVSIIIPARNERFLEKTVTDLLEKSTGEVEIIAILDGYWPNPILKDRPNLILIHRSEPQGMRAAINSAVNIAKGKYLLKTDAHCMFDAGFDTKLIKDHRNNWVQIPTRKRLDVENWEIIVNGRPDINYMYLDKNNRGVLDDKKNKDKRLESKMLAGTMAFQGSCWFMEREYFNKLELEDNINFGNSGHEAQEIAYKVYFDGGKVVRNKNTWYAHWHRDGKGYSVSKDVAKSREYLKTWLLQNEKERIHKKFNPNDSKKSPIRIKDYKRWDLLKLFNEMGYKYGAEIGVRTGRFSKLMCQTIKDLNLISVDPYNLVYKDMRSNRIGIDVQEKFYKQAYERLSVYKNCSLIKSTSLEAVKDIPYESLDFVYIDGSHDFDYVMTDIIEWAKRVRAGGIVSGHDYFRFRNAGVVPAVNIYVEEHNIKEWYLTDEKTPSWFWIKEDDLRAKYTNSS